ncbi:TATA-box-binding protein [Candidatus Micrarchaeota archaeon]|nr:TATA-box-binding protein [Candidatus Micrarchaeota archaeon]
MSKKPNFVITNMVASASLGLELDLYALAQKIREIEYEPEQFPGAILKFKDPKASLLLFKNGKVVCVGCKKREIIEKTIDKTIKMLTPYAKRILTKKKPEIEITNIVASASLDMDLDLYKIAYKVPDVEYEPEQFPGAILKFKDPKASLLLFKNGKVICAGAKKEKEIRDVLQKAKNLLKKYAEKPR